MNAIIVIPARIGSTRLPRKMLLNETGKTLIQHTWESARQSRLAEEVIVATDDPDIRAAVESFGGRVVMTRADHQSGSDRVAEVAKQELEAEILVNVQGDEPEISGQAIDSVIGAIQRDPQSVVGTLATPIRERERLEDPAVVKVVLDADQRALYFSRSPIPYPRRWEDGWLTAEPPTWLQHIGVYAYRRSFLLEFARLPPSPHERVESLEQLRILHAGHSIAVNVCDHACRGIDCRADYDAFVRRVNEQNRGVGTQ